MSAVQEDTKADIAVEGNLLDAPPTYKPFRYPWAHEAWLMQQRIHWLPEEVPLGDDVRDWTHKLNAKEKNLLTHIFRFFTQADIEVNNCYMRKYASVFKPTEICMMLGAFSNIETVHIAAYAHLLDTVGMPETEYCAFLKYKEMKDKYDHMQKFNMDTTRDIAITLAMFGAFTEGVQLFASFAILLNFQRFNKMKGMGQIVTWSARDETLHTYSIIQMFRTLVQENKEEIWDKELRIRLYHECMMVIKHEDAFIDLAFELGDVEGLTALDVKKYIRYIADRRLKQLGLKKIYSSKQKHVDKALADPDVQEFLENIDEDDSAVFNIKHLGNNPLPWMADALGVEHVNFFENRATEYSKAATQGSWDEAFAAWDESKDDADDESGNDQQRGTSEKEKFFGEYTDEMRDKMREDMEKSLEALEDA